MRKYIFLSLCFVPLVCVAQDLTGTWTGTLFQKPDVTFYFEIRIDKADDKGNVSGTTYIESYGQNYSKKGDFGTIEFTGSFTKNSFSFQEIKVVEEERKSSTYYWCIKHGLLNFRTNNNTLIIEGDWVGNVPCIPGNLKVTKEIPPVIEEVIVEEVITVPVKTLDTLENRVVETKYNIQVESNNLTLDLWDNNLVDGDIISLNLNGEWIMRDFKVKKAKKQLIIILTEKENILIMHAENLGSKPPNTAAILINDGVKEQKIVLNSDEGKSQAIKITRP